MIAPTTISPSATRRRRATPVQKIARVGLVGGLVGGIAYLFARGGARARSRLVFEMPTPVERPASVDPGRGSYR